MPTRKCNCTLAHCVSALWMFYYRYVHLFNFIYFIAKYAYDLLKSRWIFKRWRRWWPRRSRRVATSERHARNVCVCVCKIIQLTRKIRPDTHTHKWWSNRSEIIYDFHVGIRNARGAFEKNVFNYRWFVEFEWIFHVFVCSYGCGHVYRQQYRTSHTHESQQQWNIQKEYKIVSLVISINCFGVNVVRFRCVYDTQAKSMYRELGRATINSGNNGRA